MQGVAPVPKSAILPISIRRLVAVVLMGAAALLMALLTLNWGTLPLDDPQVSETTLAQLALWMAGQSEEVAPTSLFGGLAKSWAAQDGTDVLTEASAIQRMHGLNLLVSWSAVMAVTISALLILMGNIWARPVGLAGLCLTVVLLFMIPALDDSTLLIQVVGAGALQLIGLSALRTEGKTSRVTGFIIALAALLIGVEAIKGFANSINYAISVPVRPWTYTPYETLDMALDALESGDIGAVLADERELSALISVVGADAGDSARPSLRYITTLDRSEARIGLPIRPDMPARLAVAMSADTVLSGMVNIGSVLDRNPGIVAASPAEEFLNRPREWVLLNLKIFTDINLPHLQAVAEAFTQPARRNGPVLLARILAGNAIFTWGEAALGFVFGALFGLILGTVFAHSRLMERGLLPYVVASQTVPILAIAPMVVIWMGSGSLAVSVIAAYLTFFPVTINTLRGLQSPRPNQIELLRSYAASRWTILFKLRLPAAVPYIFTALKVSATASVVGAIIGELPSSVRDGLARAILDFSSSYNETSTPKLYAAIVSAAAVGILFFVLVSLVERIAMRRFIPQSS
jgi:NitT/TauT family transport system permease protein